MKKILLGAFMLVSIASFATRNIRYHTTCGIAVIVEYPDGTSDKEVLDNAQAINNAVCKTDEEVDAYFA